MYGLELHFELLWSFVNTSYMFIEKKTFGLLFFLVKTIFRGTEYWATGWGFKRNDQQRTKLYAHFLFGYAFYFKLKTIIIVFIIIIVIIIIL